MTISIDPIHAADRSRISDESTGQYLMIGTTTLAVIAVAFVGLLGVGNPQHPATSPLRIVFEGSASGLHKGGSVNFDGVQVGEYCPSSSTISQGRRLCHGDNSAPIRKDTIVGLDSRG